ncbi:MAG: hypothetical protein ACO1NQ_03500 [Flavobacteriales bacterium]
MGQQKEWLAWAATAAATLGLVGIAAAQHGSLAGLGEVLAHEPHRHEARARDARMRLTAEAPRGSFISDDGWSAELPRARQILVMRYGADTSSVRIDVYDEQGAVVQHIVWTPGVADRKAVALDALRTGRYMVRVTDGKRTDLLRFRKD